MDMLKENFKLSKSIGYVVNVVANKMKFEMEQTFLKNGYDITAHQWMVLGIIYENEGISQNELAQKSNKDKTNIARIVDKLKSKGYIKRAQLENDRRVMNLFATKEGKEIREALSKLAFGVLEKSLENISNEEQEVCMDEIGRAHV